MSLWNKKAMVFVAKILLQKKIEFDIAETWTIFLKEHFWKKLRASIGNVYLIFFSKGDCSVKSVQVQYQMHVHTRTVHVVVEQLFTKKSKINIFGKKIFHSAVCHSLIRGVIIQSCSTGAKNFTNYVLFCHPQFSGVIQNIENHCAILTHVQGRNLLMG